MWLDTSAYNAGITSVEAVAVGVPLVHISAGLKFMQRASGSVLRSAGLNDLITTSWSEYENVAVRLMQDTSFWDRVVSTDVRQSLLFDRKRSMAAFYNGIGKVVARKRRGLDAVHTDCEGNDGDNHEEL